MQPAPLPSEDQTDRLIEEVLSFRMPVWVRLVQQQMQREKAAERESDRLPKNYITSYLAEYDTNVSSQ